MNELEQRKLKDHAGAELDKQGLKRKGYAHICHLLAKLSICSDEFDSANHIPLLCSAAYCSRHFGGLEHEPPLSL